MYIKGKNRIFYQANDLSGIDIECDFLNPNLERSEKILMIYFGENLYYVDIVFNHVGAYVLRTFKNGKKLNHNIIQVGSGSSLRIYPDGTASI